MLPVLEFHATSGAARFIHERVSTLSELEHRVDDWAPRKQYQICYLALHGSAEAVCVGRHKLSLDDLLLLDRAKGDVPRQSQGQDTLPRLLFDSRHAATPLKAVRPRLLITAGGCRRCTWLAAYPMFRAPCSGHE